MQENLQKEKQHKIGGFLQWADKVRTNRIKPGTYRVICEESISDCPENVNGQLIFAILSLISVIVNGTFRLSLNFVQIPPLRYTPSTRRCCIAEICGWIR